MVESVLREYPNVLTLRVRMPIVSDLLYPRNFIAKIIKYDKVSRAGLDTYAASSAFRCLDLPSPTLPPSPCPHPRNPHLRPVLTCEREPIHLSPCAALACMHACRSSTSPTP